jgi:hypothetical protein
MEALLGGAALYCQVDPVEILVAYSIIHQTQLEASNKWQPVAFSANYVGAMIVPTRRLLDRLKPWYFSILTPDLR